YPMEIPVTAQEKAELLSDNPNPYLIFCEDRLFQIKMLDEIPYKWYKSGEVPFFEGSSQPGEIYAFQIGIYAKDKDIEGLTVLSSDFLDGKNIITSDNIHCINTGGSDYYGKKFEKKLSIKKDRVQPLWFYIFMPKEEGVYKGKITVECDNCPDRVIPITIKSQGEFLADGGVGDLWRMSRLAWLDSNKGINDNVIKPYTPIKIKGNRAEILNRSIVFDSLGMPKEIYANKKKVLASPCKLNVYIGDKKVDLKAGKKSVLVRNEGAYEFENTAENEDIVLTLHGRLEFDGFLSYSCNIEAKRDINLSDVRLDTPINSQIAKYFMGFDVRGGKAPVSWDWQWNCNRIDYMGWCGDYDAGLQVYLVPEGNYFTSGGAIEPKYLPKGWYNDNKGGMKISSDKKSYDINVYGGEKTLKKGETALYCFNYTITPFRDMPKEHWTDRVGDVSQARTNVYHLHHATRPNPYINYPFTKRQELREFADILRNRKNYDTGKITYPAPEGMTSEKGVFDLEFETNFDWSTTPDNINFFEINFENGETYAIYWNLDVKTLRGYTAKNLYSQNPTYYDLFDMHPLSQKLKIGEKHKLTVAWDKGIYNAYVDGECYHTGSFIATETTPVKDIILYGDFSYYSVRVGELDGTTVFYDDFSSFKDNVSVAKAGNIQGTVNGVDAEYKDGKFVMQKLEKVLNWDLNLYYTCRELTNHCYEIWALRSLGDEIFDDHMFMYTADGTKMVTESGGGYQWLGEHLKTGYVPGWHDNLGGGDHSAAIATKWKSRWHNYYVEGLDFLMHDLDMRGLYLDGIGYDRDTMKRVARVMEAFDPKYRINYHAGNNYDFNDGRNSTLNSALQHLAYVNSLWAGEMFEYENTMPEYWFMEMSGIPFGLRNEMLNYQNGGNQWRGMVYGMTGRQNASYVPMLKYWDDIDIANRKMIGYWDNKPLASCDNPLVKITSYLNKDSVILAVGNWDKDTEIKIKLDWKACGIDPKKAKIHAPRIDNYQDEAYFESLDNIPLAEKKGIILEVSNE
ncbi:MAG: hypothetical protein KBT47_00495, partial [Armatimonadetes bacterium]|nr:hypothetical protein [Candidatus Hippobium faecium]